MPPLRKPDLFKRFEDALIKSGLNFLRLSDDGTHPAEYQIIGTPKPYRVRVYIWNLTFGGRKTLPDEWRIQVTGLPEIGGSQRFEQVEESKTAVLGWCHEFSVFAAYDVTKHQGALGGSPSIQIRKHALEAARANGLAFHFKGEKEVAFAIKPAFMGVYLANMDALHDCGTSEDALRLLQEISEDPQSVDDQDIKDQVPEPRQYAVFSARKALREANFKERVLTAYSNACAMCGVQLRLIDAAHILPVAHPDSTDETSNGVALCALHHRAYDRGLVTFDAHYRIHRNEAMEHDLVAQSLDGGLTGFQDRLFPTIEVPPTRADRPAPVYVEQVNAFRGWKL
jgi:putative restriction endonuclease